MLRDTLTLSEDEPGIELATFGLPANPLCLLSDYREDRRAYCVRMDSMETQTVCTLVIICLPK